MFLSTLIQERPHIFIGESPLSLFRAAQLSLLQVTEDLPLGAFEKFCDLLNGVYFHTILLYADYERGSTFVISTPFTMTMAMKMESRKLNDVWGRKESAKAEQAMKLLLANPKFKTAVDALRIKWGVYGKDPQRNENIKKLEKAHASPWKYQDVDIGDPDARIHDYPDSPYYKDLLQLMRRFKLDKNYWLAALWQYVRKGEYKRGDFYSEAVPIIKFQKDEEGYIPKIALEIGRSTTFKDVKGAWHRVEELKKLIYGKQPKFKLWKNFERDSKVYALYLEGKSLASIALAIEKEYGLKDLTETNIRKIIHTYRKKLGLLDEKKKLTSRNFSQTMG